MVTRDECGPDLFRALADPTRRTILQTLVDGALPVNAIAERFEMSRPAISKHLTILRSADLVRETRLGKQRVYRINAAPLQEVDGWLATYRVLWTTQLLSLKRHLERNGGEEK